MAKLKRGTSFWRSCALTLTALICVTLPSLSFFIFSEHKSENMLLVQTQAKLSQAQEENRMLAQEIERLKSPNSATAGGTQAAVPPQIQLAARGLPPPPPPPPLPSGDVGQGKRWLTIGIPTVPRKGNPKYLQHTVDKILEQLPLREDDPLYMKVIVVVLNNKPGEHQIFNQVKQKIEAGPYAGYFHFVERAIQQTDNIHNPENNANIPNSKVRKQTRAVIALMRESKGRAGHFLFMEDDFIVCPHAIRAMSYVTSKAYAYQPKGWSGIRISYGLCGIIVMDSDVTALADYLEQHQGRRPPDHLLPEWMAAEKEQPRQYLNGRRNLGYRFNLLEHIGSVSSLRDAPQVGWPGCYAELVSPIVFEVEAWDPKKCAEDDLWPCSTRPSSWPPDFALWHAGSKRGDSVKLRTDERSGLGPQ